MRPANFHRSEIRCAVFASWFTIIVAGIAQADGPTITLQPVAPKTVPPSNYPPGSSIVGQELILGSVPARVWLEIHVTGFPTTDAPNCARIVQVGIDRHDFDMDGGGYSGFIADCLGDPANGGDLRSAEQTCPSVNSAGNAVCRQTMSGRTTSCFAGEPCPCFDDDGGPGVFTRCPHNFQDQCDPEWIASGMQTITSTIEDTYPRFGTAINDDPSLCLSDFGPSYLGTLVLDVPASAKGTYTLDFIETDSFMMDWNEPPNNLIPISSLVPAKITIPCGRCCSGTENIECVDHVIGGDCDDVDQAFTPDEYCNDCNRDGVLEGCEPVVGLPGPDKSRFISLNMNFPPPPGTELAIRVRMSSLHHVNPPYHSAPSIAFTAFEGEQRWAGPPAEYFETDSSPQTFQAASLQCTPHYQEWDWSQPLHITGSAIVPSSTYVVDLIDISCQGNESNCPGPTCSHRIKTTRWADVETPYNPPSTTEQPDLGDIAALVAKFRSAPGAPIKARLLLAGDDAFGNFSETSLTVEVGFGHIAACVDAFRGKPYPHAIAACP